MSRKDNILYEALKKNGLEGKFMPDSLTWNAITGCMQTYVEEQEIQSIELTIGEITEIQEAEEEKKVSSCEHNWLNCSDTFQKCDNCPEWKEL